jgi:hypothetical protein
VAVAVIEFLRFEDVDLDDIVEAFFCGKLVIDDVDIKNIDEEVDPKDDGGGGLSQSKSCFCTLRCRLDEYIVC